MGSVLSLYLSVWRAYKGKFTELDDPVVYEVSNRLHGVWGTITGHYVDWNTLPGIAISFGKLGIDICVYAFHLYLFLISVRGAFAWKVEIAWQMVVIMCVTIYSASVNAIPFYCRPQFNVMYHLIGENLFKYHMEMETLCRQVRETHLTLRKHFKLYPIVALVGSIVMCFLIPRGGGRYINGLDLYLLFPLHYPFIIDSWSKYILVHFVQLYFMFSLFLYTSWGLYLFIELAMHAIYQSQRLIDSMEAIEERSLWLFEKKYPSVAQNIAHLERHILYHNEEFVNCYVMCLKENIIHHQRINM